MYFGYDLQRVTHKQKISKTWFFCIDIDLFIWSNVSFTSEVIRGHQKEKYAISDQIENRIFDMKEKDLK